MAIALELTAAPTAEARGLLSELDAELSAEYPPEQRHALALDELFQPEILFWIARYGGAAAGCGGVAFSGDFAEVKRMYVRPVARGRGVAKALLQQIECTCRQRDVHVIYLETGVRQTAACHLYTAAGFRPCAAFGEYVKKDPRSIAASLFFEKHI